MEPPSDTEEPTGYVSAEDELVSESENPARAKKEKSRRQIATLYDAVAGRVTSKDTRYEDGGERSGGPHIKHSDKGAPFAPDEVLFQRKHAPVRYAEYDIYPSHERDLPRGGRDVLPESDLLKAVHSYSSHYYEAMSRQDMQDDRRLDNRSMDETALLAFGILLEEAGREVLGRRGDVVFTEAGEPPSEDVDAPGNTPARDLPRVAVGVQDVGLSVPLRKRRRVRGPSSSPETESATDTVKRESH